MHLRCGGIQIDLTEAETWLLSSWLGVAWTVYLLYLISEHKHSGHYETTIVDLE